ncbi:MAG: glycosyltransferase family 39 protein, partial [Pseudomonadota bacterium]
MARQDLWAFAAIAAITLWRIGVLAFNEVSLFVDETQYWLWGQELAFGYYSKPPLVGWVIRASNALGQSDAAFWVRLPAQLLHGVTGFLLAILARDIWQTPKAAWAGAAYATLPGVSILALFMSTDDVLLPACALALLATYRLQTASSIAWAIALGVA